MRIVIDIQGAQSESRFRGIGRYSMSLALAIARNAGEHEIWLALNGAFPESILAIRHAFEGLIPQEHIHVFEVPLPVAEQHTDNEDRARVAELIREYFLEQLNPDVILVTSLFEGYIDNAVTSVGRFSSGTNTAVILYDLIPYLDQKRYLPEKHQYDYYIKKIISLKNAALLLSISESSKYEGYKALSIDEANIQNISTAVDESFYCLELTDNEIKILHKKYNIERKILMYAPGGFDVRKNFEGLIEAYGLLSKELRKEHQLVIVSKIQDGDRHNLNNLAKKFGLDEDELVLTGYVSDEDLIALYSTATLFIFPSKHEGFGLPALEAIACGAPVIGSNTTSVPEVIGWEEALFDPYSPSSMSEKIEQVLVNADFKNILLEKEQEHKRLFSWEESAKKALSAMEKLHKREVIINDLEEKPKLAYFSPLPPVKSGISDYSAELLPSLAKYYDITLIIHQEVIQESYFGMNFPTYSVEWFLLHVKEFDRIVYQFGNSPFHSYMSAILKQYPGVVVLHDFFISGMLAYEELVENKQNAFTNALFHSHGYGAIKDYFSENGPELSKIKYPCNLELIKNAKGIITHSNYSKNLAGSWYESDIFIPWNVIPLLRVPISILSKEEARRILGLKQDDFIVSSFGFIDPTKLTDRLLDAWDSSKLGKEYNCKLILVGENNAGEYGSQLLSKIKNSHFSENIRIVGWTDIDIFKLYLEAADVGVQLRTLSRGETSAAVLDCMNYGLATVVNANGSMADLLDESVYKLPDEFDDNELIYILEKLYKDKEYRLNLGSQAKQTIQTKHNPISCAKQYMETIEASYTNVKTDLSSLITAIAKIETLHQNDSDLLPVAQAIASSTIPNIRIKQLLVDVSAIVQTDLKTGIERVVRAQLLELIKSPPEGFRVEPVFLTDENGWHYKYAREYTCELLGLNIFLKNEPVDIANGDIFYGLDFYPHGVVEADKSGLYKKWKTLGVKIIFSVYDLLPVTNPDFFPKGTNEPHNQWLNSICQIADKLICISNAVANDMKNWISKNLDQPPVNLKIMSVHLGADVNASLPSKGLPKNAQNVLTKLRSKTTFLMVGTIEPRKGHLQTIKAFEEMWEQEKNINLVIVGKEGWTTLDDSERRTIPQIISKLHNHSELNKRLFWLDGISDEYLEKIYEVSTCLIAASEGEGFGLPLIEAAQHKLPIMARDLPVFKEVSREYAYYFNNNNDLLTITNSVKEWLELYKLDKHPKSDDMPWLTWEESVKELVKAIAEND